MFSLPFSIIHLLPVWQRLIWLHNIDYVGLALSNQIWVMALSVCLIFTVTIGTFPAVTVEVKSTVADGGAWGESRF